MKKEIDILRGNIQKLVAVNANEKFLTVDTALGLIGAYMLKKDNTGVRDWEAMEKFLRYLRKDCFRGNKQLLISNYCFSKCALYIQEFLSQQPFESKRGSLNSLGLKVIVEIDDNGYLSFNDKTFNIYATQQMIDGVPAQNYILTEVEDEDNIVEDNNITESDISGNSVEEAAEEDRDNNIITEAEEIGNSDKSSEQETTTNENPILLATENGTRQRNYCMYNTPFVQLYDELIAANPEKRKDAKFVWQWFLTLPEYEAIKACLTDNVLPTPRKWDEKTARLLALYIGEFYKREYENNVTPVSKLGRNTPNSNLRKYYENICIKLYIEPYRKDNQAHRDTLFVNGGLPIHYISSKLDKAKSNLFIDGLSKLLDAENEIDISEGEEALGNVSATALRESYQRGSGHSIFEYIQAIMAGKQTWNDSDKDFSEFRGFIEKIKEANKRAAERKKFKLFYSLWTYFQESNLIEFSLQPQIRFNPEEDGDRHYAISLQRLASWGITDPPAQFALRLGNKEMRFTKCCKGDYISWDLVDRIDLDGLDCDLTTDDLLHSGLSIVFDRLNDESTQIRNDFNLPFKDGFLQFYTDDDPSMASWTSFKGAKSFRCSGLIYDKKRYHLLSPNIIIKNINEELGWVTFSDCVAFEDRKKGKTHSFFNSKGQIYAKPSEESLHTTIIDSPCLLPNCLLDGMAGCTIGGEQSHAFIVKSSKLKFDVFRVANDEKVNSSPIVEYKNAQDYLDSLSPWKLYESQNLDQGLYVFRLFNARYSTEVRCFVLPDNAKIEFYSSSTPYWIRFIALSNVSSEKLPLTERDNSITFRISNNNVESFNFTIGDNNGSISLQTYHPKPQTHVYLYYEEIDITRHPLLIAYADNIEVKYISAKNCSSTHLCKKDKIYKSLFAALTATATGENKLLTQKIKINIEEEDYLEVRAYTQEMNGIQEIGNNAIKLILLDLHNNSITEITGTDIIRKAQQIAQKNNHDGLLIQSLKDIDYTDIYYAPKFIPRDGRNLVGDDKTEERRLRLVIYAGGNNPAFITNYAYRQFEIACEHRIYFAVFDSLLSMCWDNTTKGNFHATNKKPFKNNILRFLNGYLKYTTENSVEPSVAGLKRLAREFLFDWTIIKKNIENSDSQQLKDLYQKIINN